MRLALLLCLSFPAWLPAQRRPAPKKAPAAAPAATKPAAPKPAATKWPIETLTVNGLQHYSKNQVLSVAGLKIGQMAGKEEFEAARDRLLATGFFETAGYKFAPAEGGKGYAAVFDVVEVEPVYPVKFEALKASPAELERFLKSKDPLFGSKVPGTAQVLNRYSQWLTEQQKDKVVGKLTPTGPDQFEIVFQPARSYPAVAQVTFSGNQVIPSNALLDAIGGVAIGVPYTEERFRQLLDTAVRPLYEARGRVRVKFPKITTEKAKDVEGLIVNVTVDEGQSYDIGKVQIENHTEIKTPDLEKVANLKAGDLANFEQINAAADRLKKRLRRQGYVRAAGTVDRHIDDAKKTVDLTIRLTEGPQFTFGKLTIEGLDINSEPAIRKMWSLKEGRPYNAEYPEFFLNRIREEGVFDNLGKTRFTQQVDEEKRIVDVTLYFAGAGDQDQQRRRRPGPPE